jgi:hypothetical protein
LLARQFFCLHPAVYLNITVSVAAYLFHFIMCVYSSLLLFYECLLISVIVLCMLAYLCLFIMYGCSSLFLYYVCLLISVSSLRVFAHHRHYVCLLISASLICVFAQICLFTFVVSAQFICLPCLCFFVYISGFESSNACLCALYFCSFSISLLLTVYRC